MKTLLLLIEDDLADTLSGMLPDDKAWILPERYDIFRCEVRQALDAYKNDPSTCTTLESVMEAMDHWIGSEA